MGERLPVTAATVTINGYRYGEHEAAWLGLDLSQAELRERNPAMQAWMDDRAPLDHHLRVPWCHPEDDPRTDGCFYRVRPGKRGHRFVQDADGSWWMVSRDV